MDVQTWLWLGTVAGVFCVVRGIADLRARRYLWGSLGVLAGLALLLIPVQTHVVKFDLPGRAAR
jgi:hypothetical protein